jgi:type II secretory pathway pseudopilin PulG
MRKQNGWTIVELLVAIVALAAFGLVISLVITAVHFIAKFW